MMRFMKNIIVIVAIAICLIGASVVAGVASSDRTVRIGYLENRGSDLITIAAAKGYYDTEGLSVELVKFDSNSKGLAALESGTVDVGAFEVGMSLREIASGKGFRIIAGGGAPINEKPLAELDESQLDEYESRGIVVVIPAEWPNNEKGTIIQLTTALIRAYRTQQQHLSGRISYHFNPNPDYWRLERIWRHLGLQQTDMKRDFLANHVYEEIYCDALDRLLLGDIDTILQQLFSKAICTPNCCPASATKL